jgi:hypothetical protein
MTTEPDSNNRTPAKEKNGGRAMCRLFLLSALQPFERVEGGGGS